eukprot:6182790-Pleurochrysis_carterae.AAC.6
MHCISIPAQHSVFDSCRHASQMHVRLREKLQTGHLRVKTAAPGLWARDNNLASIDLFDSVQSRARLLLTGFPTVHSARITFVAATDDGFHTAFTKLFRTGERRAWIGAPR